MEAILPHYVISQQMVRIYYSNLMIRIRLMIFSME